MKRFLIGCVFGSFTTFSAFQIYAKMVPEEGLNKEDGQVVRTYLDHNKLKSMIQQKVMNSFMQLNKSFLDYGLRESLKGFSIYDVYFQEAEIESENITKSYCIFSPKETLCGHPNIQHGGATATIADQNSGILAMIHAKQIVATSELKIKYLKPVKRGQVYVWEGKVVKRDGRKIFIDSRILQLQTGLVCVQCQILMMSVNWQHRMGQVFNLLFKKDQTKQ